MAKEREQVFDINAFIQQVIDNNLKNLHTCIPGEIISFDSVTQIAEIQPLLKRKFADDTEVELPLCINCPVMFPRAGGFTMTFPVQAGDECLVMFSERALDTWLQSGGLQLPIDTRRHSLSDAIAILGLYSTPNKLDSLHADGIEIKTDDGATYFRLEDGVIKIKGNVEIDGDVDITGESTADDHISGTISGKTHTHGGVEPGAGFTGVPV